KAISLKNNIPTKPKQKPSKNIDRQEIIGNKKYRPNIKLSPTLWNHSPIKSGVWVAEGYADNGNGYKKIDSRKLVLNMENTENKITHNNYYIWGSLWANSLGVNGNFDNGKNVHISYHKNDDGKE